MQRIAVVGCCGSGKTTFAKRLGQQLGLPVIHLDAHYWRPGWLLTPSAQWRVRQCNLIRGERWIVDGNYASTLDLRLSRADTVIVLAPPRWRCMLRVLRRWMRHRGSTIQAAGCPERIDLAFLRWVWNFPTEGRARLDAALRDYARDHARVIELRTPAEVRAFLANPTPQRRLPQQPH